MAAADPIRSKQKLQTLASHFLAHGQRRNYVLIVLGANTALRIGDLLRLRWRDVYDFSTRSFRKHAALVESKTGKPKRIALNKAAVEALSAYKDEARPSADDHLFPNNRVPPSPISRVQAYRIIRSAAVASKLDGRVSCHSLRKTFGYHAWRGGAEAVLLMDIYNHTSFDVTRRYLGICQDDIDSVYNRIDLFPSNPKKPKQ
jgi:integrase